jgi:hypothetical protein
LEVLTPKNRYPKLKNDEGLDLKQSLSQTYDLHMKECKRGLEIPQLTALKSLLHSSKFNPKALPYNGFQNPYPYPSFCPRGREKNERERETYGPS